MLGRVFSGIEVVEKVFKGVSLAAESIAESNPPMFAEDVRVEVEVAILPIADKRPPMLIELRGTLLDVKDRTPEVDDSTPLLLVGATDVEVFVAGDVLKLIELVVT